MISSNELREVIEYTRRKPSPVRMYCSRMALIAVTRSAMSYNGRHNVGSAPVFFLPRRVEDIEKGDFIINDTLLAVRV